MKADDVKRLKEPAQENASLEEIVADHLFELAALKQVSKGELVSSLRWREAVRMRHDRPGVSKRPACRYAGQHARRSASRRWLAVTAQLRARWGRSPATGRGGGTGARVNAPELTANAVEDFCRFSRAGSDIEPGSPWQKPCVERFASRVRDELLSGELFSYLAQARVLFEDWGQDYREPRPHSALGMMAPARFAIGYQEAQRTTARASYGLHSHSGLAAFDAGGSPTLQTNHVHQLSPAGGQMNGVQSQAVAALFTRRLVEQ